MKLKRRSLENVENLQGKQTLKEKMRKASIHANKILFVAGLASLFSWTRGSTWAARPAGCYRESCWWPLTQQKQLRLWKSLGNLGNFAETPHRWGPIWVTRYPDRLYPIDPLLPDTARHRNIPSSTHLRRPWRLSTSHWSFLTNETTRMFMFVVHICHGLIFSATVD